MTVAEGPDRVLRGCAGLACGHWDGDGLIVCMDVGAVCGWLGTTLGITMTQMPSKRSVMVTSLLCSLAQCAHFSLLGQKGSAGLVGQCVMLCMSVLGYFDAAGQQWASTVYWLLYPAAILAGAAPLLQRTSRSNEDPLVMIFPLVATLISVRARQVSDMYYLRLLTVLSCLPWIPYCIAVRSWSNLLGMSLFFVASCSAFVQYHGVPICQVHLFVGQLNRIGCGVLKSCRRVGRVSRMFMGRRDPHNFVFKEV